jgi:hypothetical protein
MNLDFLGDLLPPGKLEKMKPAELRGFIATLRKMPTAPMATVEKFGREDPRDFVRNVLGFRPTESAKKHGISVPWTPDQERVMLSVRDNFKTAVPSGHGSGKQLCLKTLLPTPSGWTTMGEVRVGDEVLDDQGQPTTVTFVSETDPAPESREIVFSDGSALVACVDHQWVTWDRIARKQKGRGARHDGPKVRTTSEIEETLIYPTKQRLRNHSIEAVLPLDLPLKDDLPIRPYTLGYWLGNGSKSGGYLHVGNEVGGECGADLTEVSRRVEQDGYAYRVVDGGEGRCPHITVLGLRTVLRENNLLENRHIPTVYSRASIEQRLELLRGLMDSDGYCDKSSGVVEFCSTTRRLVEGVRDLVCTLGMAASSVFEGDAMLNGRFISRKYRITFRPTVPVFGLKRKADRQRFVHKKTQDRPHRFIKDVRRVSPVPMRCIQVDSPSSCYLAGPSYITTHNTNIASIITLWWLYRREGSIVVTTAPTARQVEKVLWGEISSMWSKSKTRLPGRKLQTEINLSEDQEEKWLALGFTASPKAGDISSSRFQGLHGKYVLVVIDEATGVDEQIKQGAESLVMNPETDRILAIANPTDPNCWFKKACDTWNLVHISCENHPNVVHDDPSIIPGAVSKAWIQDRLDEYGARDTPLFKSKVLGEFPEQATDSLINLGWVTRAQRYVEGEKDDGRGTTLGLDVAGEGDDLTVLFAAKNGRTWIPKVGGKHAWHTGQDVMKAVGLVKRAMIEIPDVRTVCVDSTAIGHGVTARLNEMNSRGELPFYRTGPVMSTSAKKPYIIEVNFGSEAWAKTKFVNKKSELWWRGREALEAEDILIPNDAEMAMYGLPKGSSLPTQLMTPIYDFPKGKIIVYDKKSAGGQGGVEKTRHLPSKSPDVAHAWLLAVWGHLRQRKEEAPMPMRTTWDLFYADIKEASSRNSRASKERRNRKRLSPYIQTKTRGR